MKQRLGIGMAVTAFASYIIGGIQTFFGIILLFFFNGRPLGSWGDCHSIGLLLVCVGLALSLAGVLLMRIYQNRLLR